MLYLLRFVGGNSAGDSDLSCFYNTAFGVGGDGGGGGGGVRASFLWLTDFWHVGGWLT